jgi:hypothetical protein
VTDHAGQADRNIKLIGHSTSPRCGDGQPITGCDGEETPAGPQTGGGDSAQAGAQQPLRLDAASGLARPWLAKAIPSRAPNPMNGEDLK